MTAFARIRCALFGALLLPVISSRAETLVARCMPAVVVRGEVVHCTASIEPAPRAYTLISRTARVGEHSRTETVNEVHSGKKASSWEGPAAVSTEVSFTAKVGSTELHGQASYQVQPRHFPRALLTADNVACETDAEAAVLADPPPLAPGSTREEPVPAPRSLSRAQLTLAHPDFRLIDHGPNTFWYFVRGPAGKPPTLRILLTRALDESDPFFQIQHGDRSLLFRREGSAAWPRCFATDVEAIRRELRESEGCAGDGESSRVAKLRHAFANQLDVNAILEEMTMPLDDPNASENPFVRALGEKLSELSKQLFASMQPPPVRIACRLRYPPLP